MELIQAKLFNGSLIWNNELLSDYKEITTKPRLERVDEVSTQILSMQLTLFSEVEFIPETDA